MNGLLGTPLGDRNKYYVLRHKEQDYDQAFSRRDHTGEGWLPVAPDAADFAYGAQDRYILSLGPYAIEPGQELPIPIAIVCADSVHKEPGNFAKNMLDRYYPEEYYRHLDFSPLIRNARWAEWVYDNPGYDTDGDGYKGKCGICCLDSAVTIDTTLFPPETTMTCRVADTVWYEGDGVPDYRGVTAPPPPVIRVYPRMNESNTGEFVIRWNGYRSEHTKDIFSGKYDFEGYRVYISLAPRRNDFNLLASYDREDYNRRIWDVFRGESLDS